MLYTLQHRVVINCTTSARGFSKHHLSLMLGHLHKMSHIKPKGEPLDGLDAISIIG